MFSFPSYSQLRCRSAVRWGLCQVSMREAEVDGEENGACKEVLWGKNPLERRCSALSSWGMCLQVTIDCHPHPVSLINFTCLALVGILLLESSFNSWSNHTLSFQQSIQTHFISSSFSRDVFKTLNSGIRGKEVEKVLGVEGCNSEWYSQRKSYWEGSKMTCVASWGKSRAGRRSSKSKGPEVGD